MERKTDGRAQWEKRLKELENLNNFLFEAMSEESKQSWDMLKKAGF